MLHKQINCLLGMPTVGTSQNTDDNIHAIERLVTAGFTQCLHYSFYRLS